MNKSKLYHGCIFQFASWFFLAVNGFATEGVRVPLPEENQAETIAIEDDLDLSSPDERNAPIERRTEKAVPKSKGNLQRSLNSPQPQKSLTSTASTKKKKSAINKQESTSEISQLRIEIADLMKKVNQIENNQKEEGIDGKPPTLAEAAKIEIDKKTTSGNDKIKLALSGHVNRAVLYINNQQNQRVKHVDNDNSPTRFRIVGEGKFNDCTTIGTNLEIQLKENSSADVDINNTENATTSPRITTRNAEMYLKHTLLGNLFVGQGSMASDDTTEQDLSGTYVATQASGVEGPATGIQFIDKNTHAKSSITVGNAWTGMDGLSRKTRIRYDTPQILGTVLGVSHASSDSWDASAKIKGDLNGYKFAGGINFSNEHFTGTAKDGFRQVSGSISALIPVGLNATFSGGIRNFAATGRKTAKYWLARLGVKVNPFNVGDLALAVDYGQQKNLVNKATTSYGNGSLLTTYGLSLVQNIDKIATEAYITVRTYKLSKVTQLSTGAIGNPSFKDIWIAMAGARIKF